MEGNFGKGRGLQLVLLAIIFAILVANSEGERCCKYVVKSYVQSRITYTETCSLWGRCRQKSMTSYRIAYRVEQLCTNGPVRSPIVIVPGLFGSHIRAKFSKLVDKVFCLCLSGFCPVWLSLERIFCLDDVLKLYYSNGRFNTESGIETMIPDFGHTQAVEIIDDGVLDFGLLDSYTSYFYKMVKYFVNKGYTKDKDIRAAPFDWRYDAGCIFAAHNYFQRLKTLIEDTYNSNSNRSVTLVAHSLGGAVSLYFLNNVVSQEWKDTYIHAYIPLSAAWSGSSVTVGAVALHTFQLLDSVIESKTITSHLTSIVKTWPSMYWLFPRAEVFGNQTIVESRYGDGRLKRTYSANDWQAFFSDFNVPNGWEILQLVHALNANFTAPNVTVHCLYGAGYSTPFKFIKNVDDMKSPAEVIFGDGDGTVNIESLEVCLKWKNEQSAPFTSKKVKAAHTPIVKTRTVFNYIESVATDCQTGCPCINGDVKIIGGDSLHEGNLMTWFNGSWYSVCTSSTLCSYTLKVACKQLGCESSSPRVERFKATNEKCLSICCTENEDTLHDCIFSGLNSIGTQLDYIYCQ